MHFHPGGDRRSEDRRRGAEWIDLAFVSRKRCRDHLRRKVRRERARLVAREHLHREARAALPLDLAAQVREARLVVGHGEAAVDFDFDLRIDFRIYFIGEIVPEMHRIALHRERGHRRTHRRLRGEIRKSEGLELHMQAAGVRARGLGMRLVALEHRDLLPGAGKLARGEKADDASADHHGVHRV